MALKDARRLRISYVGGQAPVRELDAGSLESVAELSRGELVRPLPMTAEDRRLGRRRLEVVVAGWRFELWVESATRAALRERAARAGEAQAKSVGATVRAQIPGRVTRLWVAEGEQVGQGQRLLAVEAMKMENEIRAPQPGRVDRLHVAVGQTVDRGEALLSIG